MRSNTGSPRFVEKTNGLCQSPSFLDREDRGLWVRDRKWVWYMYNYMQHNSLVASFSLKLKDLALRTRS